MRFFNFDFARNCPRLNLFIFLFSIFISFEIKSKDIFENGILNIPKVVVENNVYSNVKITIKEIISIKGGLPVANFDVYNPNKNELLIPEAEYLGKTYTNIKIIPNEILSVGANWKRFGYKEDNFFGIFDLTIDSELYLDNIEKDDVGFDILAIGDVNMDGYDDILIAVYRLKTGTWDSVTRSSKPILLIYNPDINKYEVSKDFQAISSKHVWPRQATISDIDGDGRNDIFIGDHGIDGSSDNCGAKNSLILNKSTGMVNTSDKIPQLLDYSHGLIAADFNKDGKTDLLVLNSNYKASTKCLNLNPPYTNRSYLINGSDLKESSIKIKLEDRDGEGNSVLNLLHTDRGEHLVGGSADINGDGIPDIVIGNVGFITILESESVLNYKKSQIIPAPFEYTSLVNSKFNCMKDNANLCMIPYTYINFYDVDGDGQQEIIATLSYQDATGSWMGVYFQVLKRNNNIWIDITETVFPNQNASNPIKGEWCYRTQFFDFDNDGSLDILCSFYTSSIWTFSNNKFSKSELIKDRVRANVVKFPDGNYLLEFREWWQDSLDSKSKFSIKGRLIN